MRAHEREIDRVKERVSLWVQVVGGGDDNGGG